MPVTTCAKCGSEKTQPGDCAACGEPSENENEDIEQDDDESVNNNDAAMSDDDDDDDEEDPEILECFKQDEDNKKNKTASKRGTAQDNSMDVDGDDGDAVQTPTKRKGWLKKPLIPSNECPLDESTARRGTLVHKRCKRKSAVVVSDLPADMREVELLAIFRNAGPIQHLHTFVGKSGNRRRNDCYILYREPSYAWRCIRYFDGLKMKNSPIIVEYANKPPMANRDPTPFECVFCHHHNHSGNQCGKCHELRQYTCSMCKENVFYCNVVCSICSHADLSRGENPLSEERRDLW